MYSFAYHILYATLLTGLFRLGTALTRPYVALAAVFPWAGVRGIMGALSGSQSAHGRIGGVVVEQVRTNVRVLYRPNVYKRLKKQGLEKRLSTRRSLVMLWRRVIKDRHVLST